jgi:hypothetical protein
MTDGYTLNEDGTAVFEFDGLIRTLRRPKLGQYRTLIESLGEFREEVLQAAKAAEDGADAAPLKIGEQLDKLLDWFDGVFTSLAGEGLPRRTAYFDGQGKETTEELAVSSGQVIDQDRLEPWLLSGQVVTDLIQHWQTVPSRRGGQ